MKIRFRPYLKLRNEHCTPCSFCAFLTLSISKCIMVLPPIIHFVANLTCCNTISVLQLDKKMKLFKQPFCETLIFLYSSSEEEKKQYILVKIMPPALAHCRFCY